MKQIFALLKRIKGTGHATTIPPRTRCFTFDGDRRHRKGGISGEVHISEPLLAELGDPIEIEIRFKE